MESEWGDPGGVRNEVVIGILVDKIFEKENEMNLPTARCGLNVL